MSYSIENIAEALKSARETKGLSQRELSAKSAVPQSHISKIENGTVDLRLSSLVALARTLDLELELVPRKAVPAVRSIVRSVSGKRRKQGQGLKHPLIALHMLKVEIEQLRGDITSTYEFQKTLQLITEIEKFQLPESALTLFHEIRRLVQAVSVSGNDRDLNLPLDELQSLRNSLAHEAADPPITRPRRAYRLDDEDDG